jgi:uncharacterized protein
MNRLQGLDSAHEICVTLNRHDEIDPGSVLGRFEYSHPVYDPGPSPPRPGATRSRAGEGTWFVGAWWGYGFHEDGVASSDEVVEAMTPGGRLS